MKWQPMKTAPLDTDILTISKDGDIAATFWSDSAHAWSTITHGKDELWLVLLRPTHWMPLPEPPKEQSL